MFIKFIIYFIIFILLSPGIILNIPAINNKYFFTNKTNLLCAIIHSIIFAFVIYLLNNCLFTKHIMKEDFFSKLNIKKDFDCKNVNCKTLNDCKSFSTNCCGKEPRTICSSNRCDCG